MKKERGLLSFTIRLITKLIIFIILVIISVTLPFHYVLENSEAPYSLRAVFKKNNLSFDKTFINDNDLKAIIKRYNDANFIERASIKSEPLYRKLLEKQILKVSGSMKEKKYPDGVGNIK